MRNESENEQVGWAEDGFEELWKFWPVGTHRALAMMAYVGLLRGTIAHSRQMTHAEIMQQAALAIEFAEMRRVNLANLGKWLQDECGTAEYERGIAYERGRQAAARKSAFGPVDSGA